jgi:2',3'-cyclic-nucleotide 2'-phosphodiesterase (5'-nucleotidase family)
MRLKSQYVLKLMNLISLDCFTPGEMDFAEGASYLFDKLLSETSFKVLGANLTLPRSVSENGRKKLLPYTIINRGGLRVLIVGVCNSTYNASYKEEKVRSSFPLKVVQSVLGDLKDKKEGFDLFVVLSHLGRMGDEELARLVPEINVIIGGHDCLKDEKAYVVGKTLIVEPYKLGMFLGRLDLKIASSIKSAENGTKILSWENSYVSMCKEIDDAEGATELLKKYREEVVELNSKAQSATTTKSKKKVFWFEPLCQYCHKEQHAFWETTRHSTAYATLEKRGSHLDYDCVGCHTIGLRDNGGWRHFDQVEKFKNVQCEACHGPGSEHSGDSYKANASMEKTCIRCHDADHDSDFDFKKSLSLIQCPAIIDDEME